MDRPATRRQLWTFIGAHLGIWLPHRSFTAGHSTPFDFIADGFFHPSKDIAAWANRRGGKTLAASILAALEYRFSDAKIRGRVLSGSEGQAKALYEYWQEFCWLLLRDRLVGEPGQYITRLNNGNFEILAASQKRVRGPSIQHLYWDEVDEIDPEIMAASVGMLTSLHGVPSRTVAASTWHYPGGPMGKLVEEGEERGFTVHKWGVWETIAHCPPERHQDGSGCLQCPLGDVCLAKAREGRPGAKIGIAAKAQGIMAIDDAIKQRRMWSVEQWEAEAECKRPALTGMVYPQFDRRVHVKAELDFDDDLPIFRAIDWGLRNFVCLWIQEDKRRNVRVVDELWAQDATTAQVAKQICELDKAVRPEATFADPAGRSRSDQTGYSDIDVFKQHGIKCRYTLAPFAREVHNGINLIRAALKPAAGPSRLTISGKCKQLIRAFESYKLRKVNNEWIDEPVKPQGCDHPMDALRYYFANRQSPSQAEAKTLGYSG